MAEFVRRIPKWIRRAMWKESQSGTSIEQITRTYGRNCIANLRAIREYHKWWETKHPRQVERMTTTRSAKLAEQGIVDLSETISDPKYAGFLKAFEKVRPAGLHGAKEPEESPKSKSSDLLMEFESSTEPGLYGDTDGLPAPEPPEFPFDSDPPNYSQGPTFDDDPAVHGFEALAASPISAEPPEWPDGPSFDETQGNDANPRL